MCHVFLRALPEFNLTSLEVVFAAPSVNPRPFLPAVFDEFFTRLFAAFSLRCYFIPNFSQLRFFLDFVNEDDLAFAISPNASIITLGLRNPSH